MMDLNATNDDAQLSRSQAAPSQNRARRVVSVRAELDQGPRSVSIAICTRDRSAAVDRCLSGISRQTVDRADLEVLVVDNGSTDTTRAVVRQWQQRLPELRYLREPVPGLSRARNVALDHAQGEVLALLDDDASPDPSWLSTLLAAYVDGVAAAGGRIILSWPTRRPGWATPTVERWFGGLDLGPSPRWLLPGEELFGCNMSVRCDVAREVGGFSMGLGRVGRRLRSGEESHLLELIRATGGAIAYVPGAIVVHEMLPERMTRRWLLRRAYEQGRTDAIRFRLGHPTSALRAEARAAVVSAKRDVRSLTWTCMTDGWSSPEAVHGVVWRAQLAGYARECTSLAMKDTLLRRGL